MTAQTGRGGEQSAAHALPAPDGLILRSLGGEIGTSWWSRRFIELLESFGLGSRLQRGLHYARTGQVLELDVEPGIALAKVQGSRFTPYRVRIRPQAFSDHQWRRAEKAIAARALTLAKLLAGEMPRDIEEVLADAKLALLPSSYDELRVSCTCPDAANPCKHTAAVYYILAERFDEDPFALLALRGRTREELLDALRGRRAKATARVSPLTSPVAAALPTEPQLPLTGLIANFWRSGPELAELRISPLASEAPDTLLRQLGPAPPAAGGSELVELLAPAYARLAAQAERRALSD